MTTCPVPVILVFIFGVSAITTTDRGMIGGFIVLLFLFGPAAAAFSYCVSFMFKNPSLCNITLIVSGFLISMGASMSKCSELCFPYGQFLPLLSSYLPLPFSRHSLLYIAVNWRVAIFLQQHSGYRSCRSGMDIPIFSTFLPWQRFAFCYQYISV